MKEVPTTPPIAPLVNLTDNGVGFDKLDDGIVKNRTS